MSHAEWFFSWEGVVTLKEMLAGDGKMRVIRLFGCVVLSMFCVVMLIAVFASNLETASTVSYRSREYADASEEIETLEASVKSSSETDVSTSAASAGGKIASMQNNALRQTPHPDRVDDMLDYLVERSYDKCVPWYDVDTDQGPRCSWSFDSTYSFSGDEVNVVWTCRNDEAADELLAYTLGKYSSKTGLFYDINVYVTTLGRMYQDENATFDNLMSLALETTRSTAVSGAASTSSATDATSEAPSQPAGDAAPASGEATPAPGDEAPADPAPTGEAGVGQDGTDAADAPSGESEA